MNIKKGDKFLCINTVKMNNGDIVYKLGYIYISDVDGCITDIDNNMMHYWDNYSSYFRKVTNDSKIEYIDSDISLEELSIRNCLGRITDLIDIIYDKLDS